MYYVNGCTLIDVTALFFTGSLDECQLNCLAEGFRMFTTFGEHIEDGTMCGEKDGLHCMSGKCVEKPVSGKSILSDQGYVLISFHTNKTSASSSFFASLLISVGD